VEIWKTVHAHQGINDDLTEYSVSNHGRVMNTRTGRIIRPYKQKYGNLTVQLNIDGRMTLRRVSHLVAQEFLSKFSRRPITRVLYKDMDPSNCHVDNLIIESYKITDHHHYTVLEDGTTQW
jgi:hypothetical protein